MARHVHSRSQCNHRVYQGGRENTAAAASCHIQPGENVSAVGRRATAGWLRGQVSAADLYRRDTGCSVTDRRQHVLCPCSRAVPLPPPPSVHPARRAAVITDSERLSGLPRPPNRAARADESTGKVCAVSLWSVCHRGRAICRLPSAVTSQGCVLLAVGPLSGVVLATQQSLVLFWTATVWHE